MSKIISHAFARTCRTASKMKEIVWYLTVLSFCLYIVQGSEAVPNSLYEKEFLDLKRQLQDSVERVKNLENNINQLASQLNDVAENTRNQLTNHLHDIRNITIPIGFIYVQLPNQPEPFRIFDMTVQWEEITSDYAGLFFRALGEGSEAFNVTQEENSPRLTNVNLSGQARRDSINIVANGVGSPMVSSGAIGPTFGTTWGLVFRVSGGEVRPRNSAIRIWRRWI